MIRSRKQTQLKSYFFAGVAVVEVVDGFEFFDGCLRTARFFCCVGEVVSPVKYDVTFFNRDESDQDDFCGVVLIGVVRLMALLGEPSLVVVLVSLALRDLRKFLRAT